MLTGSCPPLNHGAIAKARHNTSVFNITGLIATTSSMPRL